MVDYYCSFIRFFVYRGINNLQNKNTFTYEVKKEIKDIFLPDEVQDFLKDFFYKNGSIGNPEKAYHLELLTDTFDEAEELIAILNSFSIKAKVIEKKYKFVVYVKEAENIALFLNVIGAHNSLFKFENAKAMHEMNNDINRIVNCETANITKTVNAAIKQINMINKIGIDNLPESLKEVAKLRCENPEVNLTELGNMLSKPLTKSGVNHKLKKIEEIYNENNF